MLPLVFDMKKTYTITEFFNEVRSITIEGVAKKANINSSLLRQYTSGVKTPSKKRLKLIEQSIHKIGSEFSKIKIV